MVDPVCSLLGCLVPIVLAGMGGVSRSELVSAVTVAGGFGFLGMVREPVELIRSEVEAVRRQGHERFGVNLIPHATAPELLERQVAACIELGVPVVATFWDLDERVVERLRNAGIMVVHQVGSVDEAIAAERSGVEIIIAQGREAGGHVRGVRRLRELLPDVVAAVRVPVLAAGGLATGGDLVAAQALGAAGIVLGTALMATRESFAHAYHKQRLLVAVAEDTVLTSSFHINWPPDAPVRVLKSAVTSGGRGDPHGPKRMVIGSEGERPIYLFSTDSPLRSMRGDLESMALYAGTGVGRIDELVSAGERIAGILAEAQGLMALDADVPPVIEASSSVCYASEMDGAYMGMLGRDEVEAELRMLGDELRVALREALAREADPAAEQPSFAGKVEELACWALRVQRLASPADTGAARAASSVPVLQLVEPPQSLAEAAILGRLRRILPRIGEQRIGRQLEALRSFMEAWQRRPARTAARPKPIRSPETPVASGR